MSRDSEIGNHGEILVVDDIPASLQLLTRILSGGGYRVRPASGGRLALRSVAARAPDLILLDVKMPDLDGFDVCRRLKSDERSRGIPVLFISASGETVDKVKGFEAGGVDYITKPFEPEEVLARIRTHLHICDLTERLREAKESLKKQVEVRTAELARANTELHEEIAERKQAEEELRKSAQKFRAIFDQTFQFIGLLTIDGVLIEANRAALRFSGVEESVVIGKPFWETPWWTHSAEQQERLREAVKKAAEGEFVRMEATHPAADGSLRYIDFSLKPVLDEAGNVVLLIPEGRDITERKKAEEGLHESIRSYRTLAENLPGIVYRVYLREHNRMQFFNNMVEQMTGYTTEELERGEVCSLDPLILPDDKEKIIGDVKQAISNDRPFEVEYRLRHKQGGIKYLAERGRPMRGADGAPLYIDGVILDISARKKAEETIKYQAYHDLLTGLPNRALFTDRLQHELAHMHRCGKKLGVLFLDIDQFKNINDSLGHSTGDGLISDFADRLKNTIREFDTLARIGGDDFLILLPLLSDPRDAATIADKFMEALKVPFPVDQQEIVLSASIGISIHPEDGNDPESLIKNADIALHYAKKQGRNNYQFFNDSMNVKTVERIILESRLRGAMDRDELIVHYQPQRNMKTGKITGAEALVRWNHPELGLLKPAQFIPLAEEIGVIGEIDQWVMRTACRQLRAWENEGFPSLCMTTNLSARQFQQPRLAELITNVLKETNVRPECLGIEITETIAMQDTELTARNVRRLTAMGVRFLIDDFGTGYSSLSYLKKLPIEKLKIDRSFISSLAKDRDYQAIINAIIAMAHILKMKVVAEGVETEDQMTFLNSQDCDEMQGFLFSRPVPAGEFKELLAPALSGVTR